VSRSAATVPLTHSRVHATFAVVAVAVGAFAVLQNLLFPVLTTLQGRLHTSQSAASWVISGYLLSASVFTPITGRIGDLLGKRRVFVWTMATLSAGSLVGALAPNIGVMIASRVIQGVAGGALPLAFGIIRDTFPRDQVTGAVGRLSSLTAVAGGVALILAGPILTSLGFRWLFWIPLIVTLLCAVAAHFTIPDSPARVAGHIDVLPPLLLSTFLVALLLGITEGPRWGWTSHSVLALQAGAIVAGVAWVVSELHARTPLVDMAIMRLRVVWTTNLVSFVIGFALYAGAAYVPVFVQTPSSVGYGLGASVTESGVIVLPNALMAFIAGLVVGRFTVAIGAKVLTVIGCGLGALAMGTFASFHSSIADVCIASGLLGTGLSLSFASTASLIVHSVPADQTGVATGINANVRTIGGAIGTGVMATVLATSAHGGSRPTESGFTLGFAILGAVMLAGAFAATRIPDVRSERTPQVAILGSGDLPVDTAVVAEPS
jgi:EmrB/QacA subfamily drug resistance transporter